MHGTILKCALVFCPIFPGVDTETMGLVVTPVAFVEIIALKGLSTPALSQALFVSFANEYVVFGYISVTATPIGNSHS